MGHKKCIEDFDGELSWEQLFGRQRQKPEENIKVDLRGRL
jgi:hypothetical protein